MTTDTKPTPPTLEMLRERRDEIIALAEKYGVYNVRIFGSVARGDATIGSDIDLLVDFPPKFSLLDLSGFWQDLQELLAYSVDVVEDHPKLRERFKLRILKDVIPL
jgi:predicted nucleotidyltransferase